MPVLSKIHSHNSPFTVIHLILIAWPNIFNYIVNAY